MKSKFFYEEELLDAVEQGLLTEGSYDEEWQLQYIVKDIDAYLSVEDVIYIDGYLLEVSGRQFDVSNNMAIYFLREA